MIRSLALLLLLPSAVFAQDTADLTTLTYEGGLWCRNKVPFTGIATSVTQEISNYYQYCGGKACGYIALYANKDTAAVHKYTGNDIHLIFFTKEGKKTLEYHQRILDETYMVGEWMDFHDDGTLQLKGNYNLIKGKFEARGGQLLHYSSVKDGIWEFYDEKGKLIKTEKWKTGKLVNTKKY
jgi:hypothetical protein